MKRFLLFASVALAATSMANAQAVEESTYSPNLTLEWYDSPASLGDGYAARAGIGTNGKFYIVKQNDGVYVWGKEGQIKKLAAPTAWVSLNCDDAGHVYFRNDNPGWPGAGDPGNYVSSNARFCVIDAATDNFYAQDVSMAGGPGSRFDELPHIYGDMTTDFVQIICPMAFLGSYSALEDFTYMALEPQNAFAINIGQYFEDNDFPTPGEDGSAAYITTVASTQIYSDEYMAALPNAQYNYTFSGNGWGNNIAQLKFDEDEETWVLTGKYFNTPNHSGVGGFHVFTYNGVNYIVYPTGEQVAGQPSADGFAVMKEELVDTPENDPAKLGEDIEKCVAIKFGTDGLASGNNWRGINVEPVEGKDGFFTIYFYSPGASMQVWTLDLSGEGSGIENIGNEVAAPVYYNLQGIRVSNPENGVFIEVCGNNVKKVVK